MAYQSGNFDFVINSSFKPFSMEEMLTPFVQYRDAFEKTEAAYTDLANKADAFKYLSESLPEGSKGRQIYEGYAGELTKQAEDLAANGLSMANRRALTSLKRRYSGEIGRLDKADTALQEERKRRLTISSNDPTTLYANDNLSIDDFLDRKEPNTYSVSGQKLYERGVQIGASGSSRIYSNPQIQQLTEMYNNIIQTQGYSPELIARFRDNLATIPEFQKSVDATLKEYGATDNLTGVNYDRARQSVINGIVNGITYKKSDNVQQNPDYLTEYQKAGIAHQADSLALQAAGAGMKKVKGQWVWDQDIDPSFQKAKAVAGSKGKDETASGESNSRKTVSNKVISYEWKGDADYSGNAGKYTVTLSDKTAGEEELGDGWFNLSKGDIELDTLPEDVKKQINSNIKDGYWDDYDLWYRPYVDNPWYEGDQKTGLKLIPRNIVVHDGEDDDAFLWGTVAN